MKTNKIAILVITCDKFSDFWQPCVDMFNKFWPDCPYDKYLMSNHEIFSNNGFNNILVGDDKSWSHGLKMALKNLDNEYEYVFTLLEDYYFIERINNDYMTKMFSSFVELQGNFLSLYKLPSKLNKCNSFFGELENNIPYRQSCVFTLWKIKTLNDILDDNENAWEFEKVGVKRGFKFEKFYGSYYNFKVINVLVKGNLVRRDYRILKEIIPNVNINRPMFNWYQSLIIIFRDSLINAFLNFIPSKIKSAIYFKK
jgi:hypothetical protein